MFKTKIKKYSQLLLACMLSLSVMLTAVHAKDLVKYNITGVDLNLADVQKKAMSELHNHSDTQVLKNISKAVGDNTNVTQNRGGRGYENGELLPLTFGQMIESTFLMWQIRFSMAFSTLLS